VSIGRPVLARTVTGVATYTERDECRREVAARGLTPVAVAHLTRDALGRIDLDRLAPLKAFLKRFFSDDSWAAVDDAALAELVGPGEGWWSHALEQDVRFEFGWRDGAFRLELTRGALLDDMFDGPVIPEATPNPRTIRFVTGPIHDGPSRWYTSADDVDDPRVAEVFATFDDVANVLVGPEFVAVGLHRPDRWEELLAPMLRVVTSRFAAVVRVPASTDPNDPPAASRPAAPRQRSPDDHSRGIERAWQELAALQPNQPDDLRRVLDALSSSDVTVRQVAARLLVDADVDVAAAEWGRLLDDQSRSVRRACVDAIVDADRQVLRPLLERALRDSDAWTRWKAISGLASLGIEPSRDAVEPLAHDADFRVRLEAARALRDLH
jgi:hypothetical protein